MLLVGFSVQLGGADAPRDGDRLPAEGDDVQIHPVNHATLALQWKNTTVYVDPVGGKGRFEKLPEPDLILITDLHQDHLNADTLLAVTRPKTKIIAPPAVQPQLPPALAAQVTLLANGQIKTLDPVKIEAIPAYNLSAERQKFHAKGRGNGYVLTLGGKRIYISGDTEGIPEMKELKAIDLAFVCMNLPYTMDVAQAAEAVGAFKPRIVYPYHCRGSDLAKFRDLLKNKPEIEVRIRDWYASP